MIRLHSPLAIEACLQTLEAGIDSPWRMGGRGAVVGKLNGRRLLIRKRLSLFVRNDFQPNLSATLCADTQGTIITCRFVFNPFVFAFVGLWAVFVLSFGLMAAPTVISKLQEPNHPADAWMGLGVPTGMLAFMVVLVGGSWLLSGPDRTFLLDFLRRQTDARVVSDERQISV